MNKPTKQELNAMRDECYMIACDHGWHDEKLSERHFLCLVISELMEAVEADRKDNHAILEAFEDSRSVEDFEYYIKDTVEDELADAAIRILDLAGEVDDDIGELFERSAKGFTDVIDVDFIKEHKFTETILTIVEDLTQLGYDSALYELFLLADVLNFDLMEHIKLKMEYNRTRERLHGKKY